MNSKISSNAQSRAVPNWIIASFLIVSFIGFIDATYLTVKHYSGTPLACPLFKDCEKVTTSRYATILGVPLALLGAVYYLTIILSSIAYLDIRRKVILSFTVRFTIIGLLASAWFVYLQFFVIRAICPYCMVSAVASTILFLLGMLVLKYQGTGITKRKNP
jgi:uncharacterized membrane protein